MCQYQFKIAQILCQRRKQISSAVLIKIAKTLRAVMICQLQPQITTHLSTSRKAQKVSTSIYDQPKYYAYQAYNGIIPYKCT